MDCYKEDINEDINRGSSTSVSSDILEKLIIQLEKLLNEQDLRVNTRLEIVEGKFVDIEECLSSVAKTTAMLENEVETNKIKKENSSVFPDVVQNSYITELCTNISLPGLRYVSEKSEPRLHRFLWIFLQIVALLVSVSYIHHAYHRWKSSPVVQSVKNTLTKVDEIPFPAVTICEHVSLREEYDQWEVMTNCLVAENRTTWVCSDQELNMFLLSLDIDPITFFHLSDADRRLYEESLAVLREQSNRAISGKEYHSYVDRIGVDYTKWDCSHKNNESLCDGFLSPVIFIPHQIILMGKPTWYLHKCQTYNGVRNGPHYRNVAGSYSNYIMENNPQQSCNWTPENMLKSDCRLGSDLVYTNEYVQFSTKRMDKTFFVVIHNPSDYPNLANMKPFGIQRYKSFKMKLTPKLVTAAIDLTGVEVLKRGCVFSYEKSLTMFKFYTHQNCYLECQITCALTNCGCIPHSIVVLNSSTRVCAMKCNTRFCECDCPPDCVSLSYDVDIDVDKSPFSTVRIEYNNLEFPSTFRYSVTSPAEFVAYSLGIFGVFNGFSVMLLWEILYWLTLRLWSTVKRSLKMNTTN